MVNKKITIISLSEFVNNRTSKVFETITNRKKFSVEILEDRWFYTPASTGQKRKHTHQFLQRVIDRFEETKSYSSSAYRDITVNASYTLAVIKAYLEN
jgi:hypothetical protein